MTGAPASVPGFPRLEKYELIEEIGHGGMATVYRARDPRLNREVAVKVIHKHLRENGEVATRFVAEARAAAKLRHRGIVEVFDVSNEDDIERYLVVELLRGATLRKVLQANRDMPAEVGACIVLELCEALDHAHEQGIIHRDVKPENVLVELPADRAAAVAAKCESMPPSDPDSSKNDSPLIASASASDTQRSKIDDLLGLPRAKKSGRPSARAAKDNKKKSKPPDVEVVIKLTDFGIAKILDAQGVTSTGQVLGSPAHMAPEQIEGGEVDARTDVFALGVLMYEALVGHLPFEGKNPAQVLRKVLDGIYQPADRERPSVGGRWAKILAQALARDADQRTPSPAALAEQIHSELKVLGVSDPRAEIAAYFTDPKAYRTAHDKRILPRLIARGESARKHNDVPGAAADFNRAVALAPNDPSILKRLTNLNTSRSRREMLRRAGMIAGASLLVGLGISGLVRILRSHAKPVDPTPIASVDPERASPSAIVAAVDGTASASSSASAAPSDSAKHPRIMLPIATVSATTSASATPSTTGNRLVAFHLVPIGAQLSVDGSHREWYSQQISLTPGSHTVTATGVNDCCKSVTTTVQITAPPADKPGEVQDTPVISLEIRPAVVTLAGPDGATASCPTVGLTIAVGQSKSVTLADTEKKARCDFIPAKGDTLHASVTFTAGKPLSIPWPGGP